MQAPSGFREIWWQSSSPATLTRSAGRAPTRSPSRPAHSRSASRSRSPGPSSRSNERQQSPHFVQEKQTSFGYSSDGDTLFTGRSRRPCLLRVPDALCRTPKQTSEWLLLDGYPVLEGPRAGWLKMGQLTALRVRKDPNSCATHGLERTSIGYTERRPTPSDQGRPSSAPVVPTSRAASRARLLSAIPASRLRPALGPARHRGCLPSHSSLRGTRTRRSVLRTSASESRP